MDFLCSICGSCAEINGLENVQKPSRLDQPYSPRSAMARATAKLQSSVLLGQPNSAYPESDPREERMRYGVADGSRTRYLRSHNPVLYLVSYSHHQEARAGACRTDPKANSLLCGKPEGSWSGWRDSNPRHPAPKAGALPDCATPR